MVDRVSSLLVMLSLTAELAGTRQSAAAADQARA
jgi:hypothetical protein